VVVDEGALKFIMNGADIMKPGIVYADENIKKGDFVYVAVEGKETPIAVGIALTNGKEMTDGKGKAVKNIHHLKDKIWKYFFK
ncbi:MAG: pseudouridine synthase, partial [Archaeoglobaceae archaeon]|nr:pseudouridine synthase [Archaeoglobaceae archaeon]